MTQTTTTHTAAQLAALAPRELDALAAVIVLDCTVYDEELYWSTMETVCRLPDGLKLRDWSFSTDLNAAALLKRELERRGLIEKWAMNLLNVIDDGWNSFEDWAHVNGFLRIATASAKDRTIAAILAVQDSPYLQIVTWDKHPKDAAVSSQSAHDSPAA